MAHVPHVLASRPWPGDIIRLGPEQQRHLVTVLRREAGSPVFYTDGEGTVGQGTLTQEGIERGAEHVETSATDRLTLAVAPPDSKDRVRWIVEKCTELGVGRIRWLRTEYGQGRLPRPDRAHAWMVAAVEQSRRAWTTDVDGAWTALSDLGSFVAADQSGAPFRPTGPMTVAIGPEGGWSPGELEGIDERVSLGGGVLRTETAAVAAAAVFAVEKNQ